MKKHLIITLITICLFSIFVSGCKDKPTNTIDAKGILSQCYATCQSIENGNYEMTKLIKMMSSSDTISIDSRWRFKKDVNDDIYGFLFHCDIWSSAWGGSEASLMYTGQECYFYNQSKLIGERYTKDEIFQMFIKNMAYNPYWAVAKPNSYPVPDSLMLTSNDIQIKSAEKVEIDGKECFHIAMNVDPKHDISVINMLITAMRYDFWIECDSFIPIRFAITKDLGLENTTTQMYEEYRLNSYEFNTELDDSCFTAASIPEDIVIEEAKDTVIPRPQLNVGDMSPNGEMMSVIDEKQLHVADFRGELVLLDFFFTSCPACIENVPVLNMLNWMYGHKGLRVLGVTPYNENLNDVISFTKKYEATYAMYKSTYETYFDFGIKSYPTTILLDRDGRILYRDAGKLTKEAQTELERLIEEKLK